MSLPEYDAIRIESLDIHILLIPTKEFTQRFIHVNPELFELCHDSNCLHIRQLAPFSNPEDLRNGLDPCLLIGIPGTTLNVEVHVQTAAIFAENLNVNTLKLKNTNGIIRLLRIVANSVIAHCINGSVLAAHIKVEKFCDLESINGTSKLYNSLDYSCGFNLLCGSGELIFEHRRARHQIFKDGSPMFRVRCGNGQCVVDNDVRDPHRKDCKLIDLSPEP